VVLPPEDPSSDDDEEDTPDESGPGEDPAEYSGEGEGINDDRKDPDDHDEDPESKNRSDPRDFSGRVVDNIPGRTPDGHFTVVVNTPVEPAWRYPGVPKDQRPLVNLDIPALEPNLTDAEFAAAVNSQEKVNVTVLGRIDHKNHTEAIGHINYLHHDYGRGTDIRRWPRTEFQDHVKDYLVNLTHASKFVVDIAKDMCKDPELLAKLTATMSPSQKSSDPAWEKVLHEILLLGVPGSGKTGLLL
jgi:hypothetical protein